MMCYNISASYTSPVLKVGEMRFACTRVVTATPRIPNAMRLLFRHSPIAPLPYFNYKSRRKFLSIPIFVAIIILTKPIMQYNIRLGDLSISL
jgi:hypothetical protein